MTRQAVTRLSDLCDLVAVQVDPQERRDDIYVGLEHISSGRFLRAGQGCAADVRSAKYAFRAGDILYGKLRPYLDKAVLAEDEGICTTELLVLRPKLDVDPRFVIGVVHAPAFVEHAVAGMTGVQHPRTSWKHVGAFALSPLDPGEQSKVTELVWLLHRAITANENAIDVGMGLKRAAMRKLFTHGLRGEAQKETEIGRMPKTWSAARLDQHAQVVSTRMSCSELGHVDSSEYGDAVTVLGIKVADMNLPGNEVELKSAGLMKRVAKDIAESRCAPPRTIVFPKRGAAIATNKKRLSAEWTAFDPNIIGVINQDTLEQGFLFQWFQMFDLRSITELGPTPQLNKKNLEPLTVPVPPTKEEQKEIVTVLDAIDRKIELHRRKRVVLDDLFKALLHKLMTGEVRVADLDLSGDEITVPPLLAIENSPKHDISSSRQEA